MPWTCSCGATGNGRFCTQCGQHAPLESPWKHAAPYLRRIDPARIHTIWLIGAVAALGIVAAVILTAIFSGAPQSVTSESASRYHSDAPREPSTGAIPANPVPSQDAAPPSVAAVPDKPKLSTRPLTGSERERLIAVRKHNVQNMLAIDAMLNAGSFAARVRAYCHFYIERSAALTLPGISSEREVEERYAQLIGAEPPTREAEIKRQYQLQALRERISGFEQNMSACQGSVTMGAQKLPDTEELHHRATETQQEIAEIDRIIAFGLPLSESGKTVPQIEASAMPSNPVQATPTESARAPQQSAPLPPESARAPTPETVTSPTSGVLHAMVEIEHGDAVFENLPAAQLQFTFDRNAWQATIHRQPNGTQTLVMHSLKPGSGITCDVRWEIVR
jgi:biotin carboxyl carrier protein